MNEVDWSTKLAACCVLHNICELKDEEMNFEAMLDLMDNDIVPEVPLRPLGSTEARDAIAHRFC